MKAKKQKRAADLIAIIIMIVAIGVFLYAAYQLFLIFSEYQKGEDEYDTLRGYVSEAEESSGMESEAADFDTGSEADTAENPVIEANEMLEAPISVDFAALKEVNPDIVGWIYVEAIPDISYPLVQGTNNSYYLKHTVEGVKNSSASIFVDYRNNKDWEDENTIIYGHNMKNMSMFGKLKYMKKEEVLEKSHYIWILTPEKNLCYEIFSVRDVVETDDLYHTFRAEAAKFQPVLDAYRDDSLIAVNMKNHYKWDGTDKIITLSTCTSDDTVRCVVQAIRVQS